MTRSNAIVPVDSDFEECNGCGTELHRNAGRQTLVHRVLHSGHLWPETHTYCSSCINDPSVDTFGLESETDRYRIEQ